jgi:hypothetical protein
MRLQRPITEPIRPFTTWERRWRGSDHGLIWCWERGRQLRDEDAEMAAAAARGELPVRRIPSPTEPGEMIVVGWRGGVTKKLKIPLKVDGTLQYLAEWQGLRGDDLDIEMEGERVLVCSRTGQSVLFSGRLPSDADTNDGASGAAELSSGGELSLLLPR